MRAAPARSERLGDFQPDPTPRFNTEPTAISLLLWSKVSQRGVESPLKPANRRPDDKDWTPGRAARGETRHDVESSRPSVSRTGGERSAQHRFPCGAAGIDKGAAVAPLSRSRVTCVTSSPRHKVNGTHVLEPHISFICPALLAKGLFLLLPRRLVYLPRQIIRPVLLKVERSEIPMLPQRLRLDAKRAVLPANM